MDFAPLCETKKDLESVELATQIMDRAYMKNIKDKPLNIIVSEVMFMQNLVYLVEKWLESKLGDGELVITALTKNFILIQKLADFDNMNTMIPMLPIEEFLPLRELEGRGIGKNDLNDLKYLVYNVILSYRKEPFIYFNELSNKSAVVYDSKAKKDFDVLPPGLTMNLHGKYVNIKYGDYEFSIKKVLYDKLKYAHIAHGFGQNDQFNERLFKMGIKNRSLHRHNGLSNKIFDLIRDKLEVNFELFASPLNYTCFDYSSAYYDVDRYFGSRGNFYDIYSRIFQDGGSFEAFPPCISEYVRTFVIIMCNELEQNNNPLSFFVAIPHMTDAFSNKVLESSKYLVYSVKSKKQLFVRDNDDGSNKKLNFYIMQNDSGKEKFPVTSGFIADLNKLVD
jgi:hypothetical protein